MDDSNLNGYKSIINRDISGSKSNDISEDEDNDEDLNFWYLLFFIFAVN